MRRVLVLGVFVVALLLSGGRNEAAYYPASPGCTSQLTVNQTTSTDVLSGGAGSGNNIYICAVWLISATAQSVSVIQGTGTTCGTGATAIGLGGTSASIALAANGGFVLSMSAGNFIKTTATNTHLCVLQSSSGNVSGLISYYLGP